eukprot:11607551-Ditylum_brightwellii.AAC.1
MPSYLANSKELKEELIKLNILPSAHLFTANAILMYTNIKTEQAIVSLGTYIMYNHETFKHLPITAICDALKIIMHYNVFIFGDSHWLQILGAAMGTPLAPTYAQATFGIHKIFFLKWFTLLLLLYC